MDASAFHCVGRFLALFLSLALAAPNPAWALREIQTVDSGLEEKELAAALTSFAPTPMDNRQDAPVHLTTGLEEGPEAVRQRLKGLGLDVTLEQAQQLFTEPNLSEYDAKRVLRNLPIPSGLSRRGLMREVVQIVQEVKGHRSGESSRRVEAVAQWVRRSLLPAIRHLAGTEGADLSGLHSLNAPAEADPDGYRRVLGSLRVDLGHQEGLWELVHLTINSPQVSSSEKGRANLSPRVLVHALNGWLVP